MFCFYKSHCKQHTTQRRREQREEETGRGAISTSRVCYHSNCGKVFTAGGSAVPQFGALSDLMHIHNPQTSWGLTQAERPVARIVCFQSPQRTSSYLPVCLSCSVLKVGLLALQTLQILSSRALPQSFPPPFVHTEGTELFPAWSPTNSEVRAGWGLPLGAKKTSGQEELTSRWQGNQAGVGKTACDISTLRTSGHAFVPLLNMLV